MRPAETMPAPATTLPAPPEGDEVLAPFPWAREWEPEHSLLDPEGTAQDCDPEAQAWLTERHNDDVEALLAASCRSLPRPPLMPRECVRTTPGPWVPRGERVTVPAGAMGVR